MSPRGAARAEAERFLADSRRCAGSGLALVVLLAWLLGGPAALAGGVAGWAVAGLGITWLSRGLSAVMLSGGDGTRGRRWALVSLLPRQALLAALVVAVIGPLGWPPAWFLAGVTSWIAALFAAGALFALRAPSDRPSAVPRRAAR